MISAPSIRICREAELPVSFPRSFPAKSMRENLPEEQKNKHESRAKGLSSSKMEELTQHQPMEESGAKEKERKRKRKRKRARERERESERESNRDRQRQSQREKDRERDDDWNRFSHRVGVIGSRWNLVEF